MSNAWRKVPRPLSNALVTLMSLPCGRDVDVDISDCSVIDDGIGVSVGKDPDDVATGVAVVDDGVHAMVRIAMLRNSKKRLFIFPLSLN